MIEIVYDEEREKTVTQGERNMNSQRISDRWEMLQEITRYI